MKSKTFKFYSDAIIFAKAHHGHVEGAFYGSNGAHYIVFYKEC